jgi:heptosyltransferase-2
MIQRFFALGLAKDKLLPRDLPYPSLQICPEQLSSTLAKFHLANLNQPLLVLCPGAEYGPAKRWPAKHYAEIARAKHAIGWQVWLLGSAKDQKVAAEIQQLSNGVCQDLTGKTDMGEAIDLLSLASLVVTNDSGLMHVAAALDRPIIALYGSSSAHFTPPLSNKAKILSLNLPCSPCFKRECPLEHFECLNKLLPAQVLKAADELQVI